MNDYGRIGDAVSSLINGMMILLIISFPLSLWKLIEIGVWIFKHVNVSLQ